MLSGCSAPDFISGLHALVVLVLHKQDQLINGKGTVFVLLVLLLLAFYTVTENLVIDHQECSKKGRNFVPSRQDLSACFQHH